MNYTPDMLKMRDNIVYAMHKWHFYEPKTLSANEYVDALLREAYRQGRASMHAEWVAYNAKQKPEENDD